ncbi:MAG: DNA polymerase I, partial [Candidatus Omnitrophica bacterium]|nr:DNA polymerase I [Candidatus Omnitrophota bacterium]
MDKSLYLIDGNNLIYRSYYALGPLSTSSGQPTNAALGFTTTLLKLIREKSPSYLAVAFDLKGPTFRHKLFQDYKIQRPPMPEDLVSQIPIIKEIVKALRIPILERQGYEADDVLATVAKRAEKENLNTFIITGDKDILQLVDVRIKVYNTNKNLLYDEEKVRENFGISPENIVDLIALMGDASDNIPGVSGIGEKTAVKLIEKFGSLEKLYENLDRIEGSLKEKLKQGKEIAFLSKRLAILDLSVPLEIKVADCQMKSPDYQKLREIFQRLEFKRLVKEIEKRDSSAVPQNDTSCRVASPSAHNDEEDFLLFSPGKSYKMSEILGDLESFRAILENPDIEKIGFHLKEKIVQFAKSGIEARGELFDLAVAGYLLNTGPMTVGVGFIRPAGLINQAPTELRDYYERDLQKKNLFSLFREVEMPLASVLTKLEIRGIYIDLNYLSSLSKRFGEKLRDLEREIYLASGEEFNINSPDQLRKILFEKLKLPPGKRTKKGYSTDSEVLKELSKIHHLPATLLEYRELYKLKSTYVDALPKLISKKDNRLHTTFNQIGTATGRLSSSNPNLQNIPIRTENGSLIRKAFRAEKKNLLFSFDYSQIELRILGHLSQDSLLIEAFLKDKDIHAETASLIFKGESSPSLLSPPLEGGLPSG